MDRINHAKMSLGRWLLSSYPKTDFLKPMKQKEPADKYGTLFLTCQAVLIIL